MMTLEEVIAAAQEFVACEGLAVVLGPDDVRLMQAARFNALLGRQAYPCDFWVVQFRKVLPPGDAAETPGSVLVEVVPATHQVRRVHPGMHSE